MNWLYPLIGDWRHVLPFPWAAMALTLTSLVCGAVIGTERQRREKAAGLRTLMLVCLGSAAFTMVSFVFLSAGDGRIVAQIVTGIGFLGAGVIMHGRGTVSGTTTAATIWMAAAVGMVAGSGYATGALGLSILVRFVLGGITVYEVHLAGGFQEVLATLEFDPNGGKTRVHLERILVDYPPQCVAAEWKPIAEGQDRLTMRLHLPKHHLRELLDDMVNIPEVKSVHEEPARVAGKR